MHRKSIRVVFFLICFSVLLVACQSASSSVTPGNQPADLVSRIITSSSLEKHWQTAYQTSGMDLASLECVQNQTCYSLAEKNTILRSTDGGKTWLRLAAAGLVVHGDSPFGCAGAAFCLLVESTYGGSVWATRDGGTTWQQTGPSPVNSPESLACPSPENCILVSRDGQVFSTPDGGKTWQSRLKSNGITYKKITCPGVNLCYIAGMVFAGEAGLVVKTSDGGLTWLQAGDSPAQGLRDISCPSQADCLGVGRFGVQLTQDGGQSWRALSGGENGARSVSCSSLTNCLMIDNQGQILSWDGARLARQPVQDEFSLRDVSCIPAGTCIVVGAFTLPVAKLATSNFADTLHVSLWLVFLAGLISFLSPCVLPILPGYLTYLAARSSGQEIKRVNRFQVLFHGIAFVTGFSIVFITLGATASIVGKFLYAYKEWITRLGGVIIVFFGLQMAGLLKIPFLEFELRKHAEPDPRLGYLSSLLMGVFFSAGWTPCIGPTLGIVLTLAGTGASLIRGILLLALYSLGLGLPFIITALVIDRVGGLIRRMGKLTRYVSLAAGIFLAGVGILLILGQLNFLGKFLPGLAIYL